MYLIRITFTMLLFIIIMVNCSPYDKNNNSVKEKRSNKTYPKTLSRGTAEISGTVISIKGKNGQRFYVVRIDTVIGYGGGTRPIPPGIEIELSVNNSIDKEVLTRNSSHRFVLRYMNEPFGGEVDHPWEIIKLMN